MSANKTTRRQDRAAATSTRRREGDVARREALVDEAGRESFPASDPPAWTTGIKGDGPDERWPDRNRPVEGTAPDAPIKRIVVAVDLTRNSDRVVDVAIAFGNYASCS